MALDIGCGTGRYFHYVNRTPGARLVAIDYCASMLQEAKSAVHGGRANLLIRGSLFQLGFVVDSFDVIHAVGVFGQWCRLDRSLLMQIRRLLRPNGSLFLTHIAAMPPRRLTWKEQVVRSVEPCLFGGARRWVAAKRRDFVLSEPALTSLATGCFKDMRIDRWTSQLGRQDLHLIASRKH